MPNPASYFLGSSFIQKPAPASLPSSTPPVFSGISGVTPNTDGSITASWSAGTTVNPPIQYYIYIALGSVSAGTLFVSTNLQRIVPSGNSSSRIFMLADMTTYLVNGQIYTLGVRAKDAYGNTETNTAIQTVTAIASGNLPVIFQTLASSFASTDLNLQTDHSNFVSDHNNFVSDHNNFVSDHNAFASDHTNFQNDHANFVADIANLENIITNSFIPEGTFMVAQVENQTLMTVETEEII